MMKSRRLVGRRRGWARSRPRRRHWCCGRRLHAAGLQRVEDFRAHAHGLGEGLRPHRHDHELLEVDRVVGMGAAVDDVHHRHRQDMGDGAADIAGRAAGRASIGGGLGDRERHAEDGVGAEARLVRRCRRGRSSCCRSGPGRVASRPASASKISPLTASTALQHALAADSASCRRRAVPPPHGRRSRRPTARPRGPSRRSSSIDVDLHRGIAAAVEDFAGDDVDDGGHGGLFRSDGGNGGLLQHGARRSRVGTADKMPVATWLGTRSRAQPPSRPTMVSNSASSR